MAETITKTATTTYNRLNLIENEFEIAFRRIMDFDSSQVTNYMKAIRNKKIESVSFYGYKVNENKDKEKYIELCLFVDWKKHDSYIKNKKEKVRLPRGFEGTLLEIRKSIMTVNDFIKRANLCVNFSVEFVCSITEEEASNLMKELNLVYRAPIKWKSEDLLTHTDRTREVDELEARTKIVREYA